MLATVMGPRVLVIQPIDFRTLLLYYMVYVYVCGHRDCHDRRSVRRKIHFHESTGASARTRGLGYKLILSARLYIPRGTGLTSDVITTGYRWPGVITLPLFRIQPQSH